MVAVKTPKTPCATCPFRTDAPVGMWHPDEYQKLIDAESDYMGIIFSCHKHRRAKKRGMCAGWLLDQKARNVPSIALRLKLTTDKEALQAYKDVSAKGVSLYSSVFAMARINLGEKS